MAGYLNTIPEIYTFAEQLTDDPLQLIQLYNGLMRYTSNTEIPLNKYKIEVTQKSPKYGKCTRTLDRCVAFDWWNDAYKHEKELGKINTLILIAANILDFICIHPFCDRNGRISRLLTLLLLYQNGYEIERFISLEKIMEETKDQYYKILKQSILTWNEGEPNMIPWLNYFLKVLIEAYERFIEKVKKTPSDIILSGWKAQRVQEVINDFIGDFSLEDVKLRCPWINIRTIRKVFNYLEQANIIKHRPNGIEYAVVDITT